jgi:hypothetical protein
MSDDLMFKIHLGVSNVVPAREDARPPGVGRWFRSLKSMPMGSAAGLSWRSRRFP